MANGHGSADFVLAKFQPEEQVLMDQVLAMAVDAAILAMRRSLQMAMAQYNNQLLTIENKSEENTLK